MATWIEIVAVASAGAGAGAMTRATNDGGCCVAAAAAAAVGTLLRRPPRLDSTRGDTIERRPLTDNADDGEVAAAAAQDGGDGATRMSGHEERTRRTSGARVSFSARARPGSSCHCHCHCSLHMAPGRAAPHSCNTTVTNSSHQ